MLCSLFFIDGMCIGFLIVNEAKPEKDDLMVNDYDLDECEFKKNSVLIFVSHCKKEFGRMVSNQATELIPELFIHWPIIY